MGWWLLAAASASGTGSGSARSTGQAAGEEVEDEGDALVAGAVGDAEFDAVQTTHDREEAVVGAEALHVVLDLGVVRPGTAHVAVSEPELVGHVAAVEEERRFAEILGIAVGGAEKGRMAEEVVEFGFG